MKVKRRNADDCARTKANGVVASSFRVACPAMNREPRKSVEPVDAGSCKKRPLCESGVRMVKLRCDDQLRATKKVPQNLNCDQIGGLSTAKLHSKCSSLQEMHANMNDHRDSYFLGRELTYLQEPIMESSVLRTRKRTSRLLSSSSNVEKTMGAYTKVITTGKVGGSKELFQERPSKLLKKVDAVASPHALLGEKCMHTSFKDKRTGNSEMGGEHDRPLLDTRYIPLRRIDCNGAQTSECSVASCSTANYPSHNLSHQYNAYCRQEMDGCFDDAESSCILGHRKECFFPSKEEIGSEIHKLELHAYRSTLEALHASGPLSWEQEALMTNLRLNLNISNDEHLLELRKLVSSQSF
ncbi:uncharacterized protein LOC116255978 isoform X1 [Nymphaea colorata]|nr:uncharacterized protein LOC116255978 isoform X1 [Nymphaea colorata]